MPRTYDARLVALTIGSTFKWLDNLLSHHHFPGVTRGRQGMERRISDDGLLAIEVTRMLATDIGLPVGRAADIARRALDSRSATEMRVSAPSGVTLIFHLDDIERRIRDRVVEAVESVARIPRGRPPKIPAPQSTS